MPVFEAIMLLCFGFAWPFSIYRSWRSRSTKGKSLMFMIVVIIGYIAGIIHKLTPGNYDWVIYFYILDILLVITDLLIWIRNRHIENYTKTH